jgi:hypothetical protein
MDHGLQEPFDRDVAGRDEGAADADVGGMVQ